MTELMVPLPEDVAERVEAASQAAARLRRAEQEVSRARTAVIVRESWLTRAAAVEAYREQWRVEAEQVGKEENRRGAQALAWEGVELQLAGPVWLEWLRWTQPSPDRGLDLER